VEIRYNKVAFKADHPRMRAFSYAWSLPVTWQRQRSHRSIRHIWKPLCYTQTSCICFIEPRLLPIKVLQCGNKAFRPFLLMWPWPWSDDLHMRTWSVFPGDIAHRMCKFRKLSSGRQTDRQTGTKEII